MTPSPDDRTTSHRWAPWWIYLIVLLGANYLRSWLLPTGHLPVIIAVVIALGQAAVLFAVITIVWPVARGHDGSHKDNSVDRRESGGTRL